MLKYQDCRNAYNSGYILHNHNVMIFSLLGMHFTTNKKRARNGRHYKLDDAHWMAQTNSAFHRKIWCIISGKVQLIKEVS